MSLRTKIIILAAAAALLTLSFKFLPRPCADCKARVEETASGPYVKIGSTAISVEIADTAEERQKGLSDREELAAGSGLLFIFDTVGRHGIWMKDMRFSIDIVWADADGRIVGIERDVSPATYPKVFHAFEPAKYVLELPAGFCDTQGIEVGEILSIGQ